MHVRVCGPLGCSGVQQHRGAAYVGSSWLLLRCGVDDPLDSSTVHMGNGLLGSILVAFVAKPEHVLVLTGSTCGGLFYTSSGWLQLGLQLLGECLEKGGWDLQGLQEQSEQEGS